MFRVRFGNKYGAKTSVHNGISYHSKKEAGYAAQLELRLRAGDIKEIKRQVSIPLDVNGRHICNYIIDFVVTLADGTLEYIEVKGFETDVWRIKWKLFEALFGGLPGMKLTVVR